MSSINITDAEVAALMSQGMPEDFIWLSSGALVLYDYALTFFEDVELLKSRRRTGPSVLLMLNRCFMLLFVLGRVILQPNWQSLAGCETSIIFSDIPQVLLYLIWAAVSGLRVYAMSDRKLFLSLFTVALVLVPIALIVFQDARVTGISLYYLSATASLCTNTIDDPVATQNAVTIGSTVLPVAADAVVLLVTWWKTYGMYRQARQAQMRTYLGTILLRDGTIYFLGLLVLNSVGAGVYMKYPGTGFDSYVSALTSIVISRFLLSLQGASASNDGSGARDVDTSTFLAASTSVRFATQVVGNMGADLNGSFGVGVQSRDGDHDDQDSVQTSRDSVSVESESHLRETCEPLQNC